MNRNATLESIRRCRPVIAPSMLKCDFGNLQRETSLLESAGADLLHWDVMDGHFVPNLSYGPMVIRSLRRLTGLIFDAHLMISEPARYVEEFLDAGCQCVTFHVECVDDPRSLLQRIRQRGAVAGLALNPQTPLSAVESVLPECDLVLLMSVEPGFGGQQFIPSVLEKLRTLREQVGDGTLLSIDGGIGPETIGAAAAAGADIFVAGSAIFDSSNYESAIAGLRESASATLQSSSQER
ncbi:MAG: ribulose-phosphate 3-epimerase [Planctomycetes bacterium]|nr:ribulose-phosphate 3-epimerase [Planctomycetota bacterium]